MGTRVGRAYYAKFPTGLFCGWRLLFAAGGCRGFYAVIGFMFLRKKQGLFAFGF